MDQDAERPGGPAARVDAVVVHYGSAADTRECLASLRRAGVPADSILVVDNSAEAGVAGRLAAEFPGLAVRGGAGNAGYAAAANAGIAWARERGGEFALLLNNDTVIEQGDFVARLVQCARRSGADLAAPVVLNRGRRVRATEEEFFFPGLALTLHSHAWPLPLLKALFRHRRFLTGTAILVRLAAAPLPLLDPAFRAYFEDVDLCLRVGESRLAWCRDARIVHKVSRGTAGSTEKHRLKAESFIRLARKHGLDGWRFRAAFWLLFVPTEYVKYGGSPVAFWRLTRRAAAAGARPASGARP
jgi:GT2 family glycosyltransferase